jgi:uncharacterized membrane protein YbhN (UPF0104 family)
VGIQGVIKTILIKRVAGTLAVLGIVAAALWLLHHNLRHITWSMVSDAIAATSWRQMALAGVATAISFSALAAYEIIALGGAAAKRPSWASAALVGAAGNAVANTIGFHAFTISLLRYRVYSRAGVSVGDMTRITGVAFLGVVFAFISIVTLSLLIDPPAIDFLNREVARGIGVAMALGLAGFIGWLSRKPRRIGFRRWHIPLPGAGVAIGQICIGIVDMGGAIVAAYALLPDHVAPHFAHFALLYIGAVLLGILSHAPGGIGVFEVTMMTALGATGRADVLAALLLYRLIYNITPSLIGALAIGLREITRRRVSPEPHNESV